MKPILFNTEMVKAIMDGRKTVTRRLVKFKAGQNPQWTGYVPDGAVIYGSHNIPAVKSPYQPGDVLYVRETWQYAYDADGNDQIIEETGRYLYAADDPAPFNDWIMPDGTHRDSMPWHPSIHMPKEAARIFLRVKQVSVERLQDITEEQAIAEGCTGVPCDCSNTFVAGGTLCCADCNNTGWREPPTLDFFALWDSTIKPADLPTYGWDANPWVWVIEFEKISKEEATKC